MISVGSFGGGTNSTGMFIGLVEKSEPVDLILFADTRGERPGIYKHIKLFSQWLQGKGYPAIVTVQNPSKSLEQDCLDRKALPSIAYGFKTCSQRWKLEPQNKYLNNWQPARDAWARGEKIVKLIGYDADEPQRAKDYSDDKYHLRYPLIEWGWGRAECVAAIIRAGLPLPGKSACFFCPSMKKGEILRLQQTYPELADRAIAIEQNAKLTQIKGLGRRFSWAGLLAADNAQYKLFADSHIEISCECYDG